MLLALTAGLMAACSVHDDNPTGEPFVEPETDFAPAGAEAVDLGLPSGTKWANMNVGAEAPEDYGLYFAWGETVGYKGNGSDGRSFDWENYKWGAIDALTKYNNVDNKTVLDPEDDAAHVNWGGKWRMPTYEDNKELATNTTVEWTTQNGVNGFLFTSKTNGNSIFLPAAGYSGSYNQKKWGYYWSATLYANSDAVTPYYILFGEDLWAYNMINFRNRGFSVRPVQ